MPGKVQVYTGDGKGKTTASLGLIVRACGAGMRIFFGQFIKRGDFSEIKSLKKRFPEVTVEQFGLGKFIKRDPAPEDIEAARHGLQQLKTALTSGQYDMVIADEANGAVKASLFTVDDLLHLLKIRPDNVELVITGRGANPRLIEEADLVSEILPIKHYFDADTPARVGIEI